jgi:hypothetical protein
VDVVDARGHRPAGGRLGRYRSLDASHATTRRNRSTRSAAFDLSRTNELTDEDLGAVDLQLNEDELLAYLENEDITDLIVELE